MAKFSDLDIAILKRNQRSFLLVFILSGCVNILMLTGAIYMLQVYDRVLLSRSGATLFFITLMIMVLYLALYFFDIYRQKILALIGRDIEEQLAPALFDSGLKLQLRSSEQDRQIWTIRDLEEIGRFLSGSGLTTLFDLPWMPLFVFVCFLFHPLIGLLTIGSIVIVMSLAVVGEIMAKQPTLQLSAASRNRQRAADSARRGAEVAEAMGFTAALMTRFEALSRSYHATSGRLTSLLIDVGAMTRTLRIAIQSLLLGVAAWLVINDQATPGVMIASSIIASRALAPIDQIVGRWRSIIQARDSWARITTVLSLMPGSPPTLELPLPTRGMVVEGLSVSPPGSTIATARNISFRLEAGQVLGVVGPSGSGKSTLIRALAGAWQPMMGGVRIDGALLEQFPPHQRGMIVGYLPQDVQLMTGTVAENIARFDPEALPPQVIEAAKRAGAHEMILSLSSGYATPVGEEGAMLSGGQRQRIGLARALYGDPFIMILDEPNSNLDMAGERSLVSAIKHVQQRGGIVILVAHRLNMLDVVGQLLLMVEGEMRAFGNRDEVLAAARKMQERDQGTQIMKTTTQPSVLAREIQ